MVDLHIPAAAQVHSERELLLALEALESQRNKPRGILAGAPRKK